MCSFRSRAEVKSVRPVLYFPPRAITIGLLKKTTPSAALLLFFIENFKVLHTIVHLAQTVPKSLENVIKPAAVSSVPIVILWWTRPKKTKSMWGMMPCVINVWFLVTFSIMNFFKLETSHGSLVHSVSTDFKNNKLNEKNHHRQNRVLTLRLRSESKKSRR